MWVWVFGTKRRSLFQLMCGCVRICVHAFVHGFVCACVCS